MRAGGRGQIVPPSVRLPLPLNRHTQEVTQGSHDRKCDPPFEEHFISVCLEPPQQHPENNKMTADGEKAERSAEADLLTPATNLYRHLLLRGSFVAVPVLDTISRATRLFVHVPLS